MCIRYVSIICAIVCGALSAFAQPVQIRIDANAGRVPISPLIYGRNNNLSDNPSSPLSSAQWQLMRDAGLRGVRENGGNNATKYQWRKKLTSHPDWYNNVYHHDWDFAARSLQDSLPGVRGMFALQLIGKAASNTENNFNDWGYNQSQWWSGTGQNLAGGGTPNPAGGGKALKEGNPALYLEDWPPDSSAAILDHWFGAGGLHYDTSPLRDWSMDNEPEIWVGTHDDVMPVQPSAEEFMQRYFAVAKAARARFPHIKLTGPVPASEWQWYAWDNAKVTYHGVAYPWLEYFIKRIGEEEAATGVRLLDVIDLHCYPGETQDSDIVQLSRLFFDTTYRYPGANGVKLTGPTGWDNTITHEFVLERCNRWLAQYLGPANAVTCGISEFGCTNNSANVTAVCYASILGTFADHGVEYFMPWNWNAGMWETMHLFSRFAKPTRVQSVSSDSTLVGAYSSMNAADDSMTVVVVNRDLAHSRHVSIALNGFAVNDGSYDVRRLVSLPSAETFVSHTQNALQSSRVDVAANACAVDLPPLSITALMLSGRRVPPLRVAESPLIPSAHLRENPVSAARADVDLDAGGANIVKWEIHSMLGQILLAGESSAINGRITIPVSSLRGGAYWITLTAGARVLPVLKMIRL